MRRANEIKHAKNIEEIMEEFRKELEEADLIFLNAPGINKLFFMGEGKPLSHMKEKVKSVSFSLKKANYTEV